MLIYIHINKYIYRCIKCSASVIYIFHVGFKLDQACDFSAVTFFTQKLQEFSSLEECSCQRLEGA